MFISVAFDTPLVSNTKVTLKALFLRSSIFSGFAKLTNLRAERYRRSWNPCLATETGRITRCLRPLGERYSALKADSLALWCLLCSLFLFQCHLETVSTSPSAQGKSQRSSTEFAEVKVSTSTPPCNCFIIIIRYAFI